MMMRPADAPEVRDKVLDGVAISDDERLKALRTIDELGAAMVEAQPRHGVASRPVDQSLDVVDGIRRFGLAMPRLECLLLRDMLEREVQGRRPEHQVEFRAVVDAV